MKGRMSRRIAFLVMIINVTSGYIPDLAVFLEDSTSHQSPLMGESRLGSNQQSSTIISEQIA
jgi:hypothetical protein